jgi:hypothetical protein
MSMVQFEDGVNRGASRSGPGKPDHARRATLARLAGLCGLALSGTALDALAAPKAKAKAPEFLTRDELALTGVLAELIIPRTDTPGALAVGAHHTIDHLLAVCALEPAQQAFRAGLARLDASAQAQLGKPFAALPRARQVDLLTALDNGAAPFTQADTHFFRMLKQYTLFAYYTSEAGATRELAYLPVPGGFNGKVKVTKSTRTWAL